MNISVIICTYNRCDSLHQTLQTFCDQVIPPKLTWELLVMDNNSNDATRQVCERFARQLPLKYIFEPRQGKSYALNHALTLAEGSLCLFTDDDVDLDANWIACYWAAAQSHPPVALFGGKVIPRWERTPPAWLEQNSRTLLRAMTCHWDMGDTERMLGDQGEGFIGANMAFRASVFAGGVRFRADVSPTGNSQTRGEESEVIERLRREGAAAVYVPTAVVYHRNPVSRMTEKYLRAWYRGFGISEVRLDSMPRKHLWFFVPRNVWKQFFVSTIKYALSRWSRPAAVWIEAELRMAKGLGFIQECWRTASLRISKKHTPREP